MHNCFAHSFKMIEVCERNVLAMKVMKKGIERKMKHRLRSWKSKAVWP